MHFQQTIATSHKQYDVTFESEGLANGRERAYRNDGCSPWGQSERTRTEDRSPRPLFSYIRTNAGSDLPRLKRDGFHSPSVGIGDGIQFSARRVRTPD